MADWPFGGLTYRSPHDYYTLSLALKQIQNLTSSYLVTVIGQVLPAGIYPHGMADDTRASWPLETEVDKGGRTVSG